MPLNLKEGDAFPSHELTDDTGRRVTIADVAAGSPLILTFYRGPW